MDDEVIRPLSIAELKKQFEEECYFVDDRAAAEYAYALAVRLRSEGNREEARRYAREALRFAQRLPSSSLDDVTASRTSLGGVPMPELFHDGVVKSRLRDLLVSDA
jgi:hypothetical protein